MDAVGHSGGLWVMWREEVGQVTVEESNEQFIYAIVRKGLEVLHLITVYAAPSVSRRSVVWSQLRTVINRVDGPLLIGGDFNTILRLDERTGGSGGLSPDSLAFGDWIHDLCRLLIWGSMVISLRGDAER